MSNNNFSESSPEDQMKKEQEKQRGTLKIFLGYAPGVGKTFATLCDANIRLSRGENIIIGYLETHGRKETISQIGKLETIPRKKIEYNGIIMEEMDTEAIIAAHPDVVIVDELAHTNVPGSKNLKRYEDVEEILKAGINVISTLNIQHLESLNDIVRQITGIVVKETIPDRVLEEADEVEIVDLTPNALQNRLIRGNVYKSENVQNALKNFFRKGNLNALREIALRQAAEDVDIELEEYMQEHEINKDIEASGNVMICINSSDRSKKLIRRGARIARRYNCKLIVVSVECTSIFAGKMTEKDKENIESHFKLAKQLDAEVVSLTGKSVSEELTNFAGSRHITQMIIGHSTRPKLETLLRGSTIKKLLKHNKGIEIHVIPHDF